MKNNIDFNTTLLEKGKYTKHELEYFFNHKDEMFLEIINNIKKAMNGKECYLFGIKNHGKNRNLLYFTPECVKIVYDALKTRGIFDKNDISTFEEQLGDDIVEQYKNIVSRYYIKVSVTNGKPESGINYIDYILSDVKVIII